MVVYLNHLRAGNDCLNYILYMYFLYLHLDLTLCISAFHSHWNYYYIKFKYFHIALLVLTEHAEEYFHRKCVLFPCIPLNWCKISFVKRSKIMLSSDWHLSHIFRNIHPLHTGGTFFPMFMSLRPHPLRFVMNSSTHLYDIYIYI